jgi:hypothetical protein
MDFSGIIRDIFPISKNKRIMRGKAALDRLGVAGPEAKNVRADARWPHRCSNEYRFSQHDRHPLIVVDFALVGNVDLKEDA